MGKLRVLPCLDSDEMAASRRQELDIPRKVAADLGQSAVKAVQDGFYVNGMGEKVEWHEAVQNTCARKRSIPPDAPLPGPERLAFTETTVQVTNETTLGASRHLVELGARPLALNFANGVSAGGGFLRGATAQEEVLCRSSALYPTLDGDSMYEEHQKREQPDSTDWAICSPDVPVFRSDDGAELDHPWLLSVITCAAPYAPAIGQPRSGDLLEQRIHRVLAIALSYGHTALVLGAWGCGAFENDPQRTAVDFREALVHDYDGAFSTVVFAVADWSPERRFLGPFRDAFAALDRP